MTSALTMPQKRKLSSSEAEAPPGFVRGRDIDLASWHGGELVIDLRGHVTCYVGYMSDNQPFDLPYYSPRVALQDAGGRASRRFIELQRGMLFKTSFLNDDAHYRVLDDRKLVLPRGIDSSFGVVSRTGREEDVELTRQVFGGTRTDIETIATALSRVVGRDYHAMSRLPRVTFSKTGTNRCDFARCLIPKDFPYLAFEDSQYAWSHMSLHGFFSLLAFLCGGKSSPIQRALLESGVSRISLDALLDAAKSYGEPLPCPEHE